MEATGLRLLAHDSEGLQIVAAAVQDALVRPSAMQLDAKTRTFGLELNRFQWERAGKRKPWFRIRSVLAFNSVLGVKAARVSRQTEDPLVLLDVAFVPGTEPPAGDIRLFFAGGGEVRLEVECLDATLLDTGPAWPTRRKPDHGRRS